MNIKILMDSDKGKLFAIENFCPDVFDEFADLKLLHEPEIVVFGKTCHQRRNVGFYSNVCNGYKYSGQIMLAQPLNHPLMLDILEQVNAVLGTTFNSILVNEYVNGTKYVSAHSDDERGLDPIHKYVASVSFGATRIFQITDKFNGAVLLNYEHQPTTLLVMAGNFQDNYKHAIIPQPAVKKSRISLTFRTHIVEY